MQFAPFKKYIHMSVMHSPHTRLSLSLLSSHSAHYICMFDSSQDSGLSPSPSCIAMDFPARSGTMLIPLDRFSNVPCRTRG